MMPALCDLYRRYAALEAQLRAALPDAFPLGAEVCLAERPCRVVNYGAVKPELLVEDMVTGRQRWLPLWLVFEDKGNGRSRGLDSVGNGRSHQSLGEVNDVEPDYSRNGFFCL